MMRLPNTLTKLGLWLAGVAIVAGCTHIGRGTVEVDRFDYSTAIANSWKEQTLLNIVKLRYLDLPVFVDVSSIVAGYSMQTGVNLNGTLSTGNAIQGNFASAGGQMIYTDRPTVTYVPLTGDSFLRGLLTPIDPKNIFFMLQSGYAADFILGLTVESLNGVRNRSIAVGTVREADPRFTRALQLLRKLQADGAFGMRVEEDKTKGSSAVLFFRHDKDVSPETTKKEAEVRQLLKVPPDLQRLMIVYSPMPGAPGELAVNSRSMLQIMAAFASYTEVPEEDVNSRRALPAVNDDNPEIPKQKLRIHSGKVKPMAAFASVYYRNHWFWVDDDDLQTKRALTAVMFFFTLAETGKAQTLPLITIPAQ